MVKTILICTERSNFTARVRIDDGLIGKENYPIGVRRMCPKLTKALIKIEH